MTVEHYGLAQDLREEMGRIAGVESAFGEPLARHCSFGVGGPADAFCTVRESGGLRRLLDLLAEHGLPWMPLGRGSNVVFLDSGFRGVVIMLAGEFERVETDGTCLSSGAATALSALVSKGLSAGLGGLEFTAGIPGCVGGSLPGNSGTARDALGDRLDWAEIVHPGGSARRYRAEDLGFGYRTSRIPAIGGVIVSARFRMEPREPERIREILLRFMERRKGQPYEAPSAGCIFKNPSGTSAGQLIDAAGLKGLCVGGVTISGKHANFMVNSGTASAADLIAAILTVRERVRVAAGVLLEPEIRLVDETGQAIDLKSERFGRSV
jgi:UDP-N-acetylmuramate dehydrogenase